MKLRSIILLSGGLDSTVCAAIACERTRPLFALTFDYGQRSAKMEIAASRRICRALGVKHKVVRLPFFKDLSKLAMLKRSGRVASRAFGRTRSVWVPNRNGLFINIAACYAEYHAARVIVTGFNREEAASFPDNSRSFVRSANAALRWSTLNRVRVTSYTLDLTKKEIYRLGVEHGAPLEHVYSCYVGRKKMCGRCASCRRLIRARQGVRGAR